MKQELIAARLTRMSLLVSVMVCGCFATRAQVATGGPYALDQAVIAGGGGTGTSASTGGNIFSVTGTNGQPLAGGPIGSSPFSMFIGFWTPDVQW